MVAAAGFGYQRLRVLAGGGGGSRLFPLSLPTLVAAYGDKDGGPR